MSLNHVTVTTIKGINKRNSSADVTHALMFSVNQYVHIYMQVLMYNDDGLVSMVVVM